jgi:hypothetical protein
VIVFCQESMHKGAIMTVDCNEAYPDVGAPPSNPC